MKKKTVYICRECGTRSPLWKGQCSGCQQWNTLEEKQETPLRSGKNVPVGLVASKPVSLADHPDADHVAYTTSIEELDAVLGGGLVPGGAVLLGGEPGIGKSTILLQLCAKVSREGRRAVYVSGEESLSQIKGRARRLDILDDGINAMATNDAEAAANVIDEESPDLIIIDSVQTMASREIDGHAGSVSQVRTVSQMLIERTKASGTTLILVGHVTKDGQIAGPKLVEHMVDTVLYLEGDRRHLFRILRVLKNRFGPSDELLVMEMGGTGLTPVPDPSTYFLEDRDDSVSGSAVVMTLEGRRPFAVEVQALASKTYLAIPRRTALGFDQNRLHLLLAVIEKRLGINLGQSDIYTKIGGGLKMNDPGLDLGIVAAILSSFFDRPLPKGALFWGEIDLNGRIRPVEGGEVRVKQAKRLGYKPLFHPSMGKKSVATLVDLYGMLFE